MLDSLWELLFMDLHTSMSLRLWIAFVVKSLLISLYACLIYFIVFWLGRILRGKMSAQANYYRWYALLLAFPLSGLDINATVKLPIYELIFIDMTEPALAICNVLGLLWFIVVLYRLESQIVTFVKLEGAISVMKEADAGELKANAANAFKLNARRIRIVTADWVITPVSYGVFKKVILLPQDYKERYSDSELYLLLLHEMAHIKNGDTVKIHIISFAQCLFPLNPGFMKEFKLDTEILCDSRVINAAREAKNAYGDLLVKECSCKSVPIKGLAFSDSYNAFESRLDALLEFTPETHGISMLAGFVFALLLASFVYSWFVPDMWFRKAYPESPQYDAIVLYEDEDYYALSSEYFMAMIDTGAFPESRKERPAREFFDSTVSFKRKTATIDKLALREAVKSLPPRDAKPVSVIYFINEYNLTPKNFIPTYYPVYIGGLENIDESNTGSVNITERSYDFFEDGLTPKTDSEARYAVIDRMDSIATYIYTLLAHWM